MLDGQRRVLDFFIIPLAGLLRHVNPNVLTVSSLLMSLPAAWLLWRSSPATEATDYFLVFASLCIIVHGVLDLLDGVVARRYNKATPIGDFLDHVFDRVADVLLLTALSMSDWGDPYIGLVAIAATLLTSYLGTQAQAVGAGRLYAGFVGRADRLVLLMAAPLADHILVVFDITLDFFPGAPAYVLGYVLWYIALGGIITSVQRFLKILANLRKRRREAQAPEPGES